jgi:anaerobic magnesium-protoporphyrin IX monomethyl ester cyclase
MLADIDHVEVYWRKMTRVLLVNTQSPYGSEVKKNSWIRMGLAYLSASLKADGHIVDLADIRTMKNIHEVISKVSIFKPELVCITALTAESGEAIAIGHEIKKYNPEIYTMIGGIHASIAFEDFKRAGCFDFIIRGEGEMTVPAVASNLAMYHTFPSVIWGEPPDLNKIPFPDRELWNDYKERVKFPPSWGLPSPWIEFMNSRGCPYHCRFCSGPGEQNHFTINSDGNRKPYIRSRSVENAILELQELDSKYHFKGIQFHDDQFILNPVWTDKFCDAIIENGLDNKRWWVGSRADVILRNKSLVLKMKKAGLDIMSVGFESFSDELLTFWNKGTTSQMNHDAAKFLNDNEIRIFSNTIMGAPRADGKWYIEDDIANIDAIKKIKPSHISWSLFTAVPGSELYQWCIDKGLSVAGNTGLRNSDESKIKGVNLRQIRILIDEVIPEGRPFYHNWYDRVRLFLEGN